MAISNDKHLPQPLPLRRFRVSLFRYTQFFLRRLDHRLDALHSRRPATRLEPDEHAVQFQRRAVAVAALPLGRFGLRYFKAAHVRFDMPQQIFHGLDSPRRAAGFQRVAVLGLRHLLRIGSGFRRREFRGHALAQRCFFSHAITACTPPVSQPRSLAASSIARA